MQQQGDVPAVLGDEGKATKTEAQYGPGGRDHCGVCRYFIVINPQRTVGRCVKVRGAIRSEDWCRFFAAGGATHHTTAIDRAPPKGVGAKAEDR